MTNLLDALDHHCFHTPFLNLHQHPDLHHCTKDGCNAAISTELAKKAGLHDGDAAICPTCGETMEYREGEARAEVHFKLCTDETIHYPELHRAGKISREQFEQWKSTLTRDELLGHYKRVPDIHVVAHFTHEETALITSDRPAFNEIMQQRVKEAAERALRYSAPHAHNTVRTSLGTRHPLNS